MLTNRLIPSVTVDTTPPCEHFGRHNRDALVYHPPARREGDLTFACPCCGGIAYAAPHEVLPPCPACGVSAVQVGR